MAFSLPRRAPMNFLRFKSSPKFVQVAHITEHERNIIGRREIVGYGFNGQPWYVDLPDFPFPAIRWKEPTPESEALRQKEKGDWNELTCEEKKALYRFSFCQTFAEFKRTNDGQWKSILAMILYVICPAFWIFFYYKMTIYRAEPLPETFQEERRAAMFRRWLDLKANPIEGLAAKWDYEKDDWKNPKDPWRSK